MILIGAGKERNALLAFAIGSREVILADTLALVLTLPALIRHFQKNDKRDMEYNSDCESLSLFQTVSYSQS